MVQMASPPRHLLASCFNSPDELDSYNYRTDGRLIISVHDGILEISNPSPAPPVNGGVTTKDTFPGSGIRVKARIEAETDAPNPGAFYSLIIVSDLNYDPNIPIMSRKILVFGYSPPYLYYATYFDDYTDIDLYAGGSWDGSRTGYHTFEVALYPDRIELYADGSLVSTYNGNPLADDQVHIGFTYDPYGEIGRSPSIAVLRADWLFIDPIDSPPGDPPDLLEVCGGGPVSDINSVASSVMGSLAITLDNITSFISGNVNTIAGVVFATGFTSMLYKYSRGITSAVIGLLRR